MGYSLRVFLIVASLLLVVYDVYGSSHSVCDSGQWICIQRGIASWYGVEEEGKATANGERYNRHKFTAASRVLPFNTIVRVTNRQNGRSVEVRINDRGPFVKGRLLDVSEAAAISLQMIASGVAQVDVAVREPVATAFSETAMSQ